MLIPSVGDVVLAEVTSNGVGTGEKIEVEVLHVHSVRKTGRTQVQVRSVGPVRIGRTVGRKVDYSPMVATQYIDPKWLSERPAPVERVERVEEATQMTDGQAQVLADMAKPKPMLRHPAVTAAAIAAIGMANVAALTQAPGRRKK